MLIPSVLIPSVLIPSVLIPSVLIPSVLIRSDENHRAALHPPDAQAQKPLHAS